MKDYEYIRDNVSLARVIGEHRSAQAVAVDTEFMRRNTFFPQPALLQLCFGDIAWLIDPLAVTDLDPVRELFTDPGITKVLHSPSEDLEVFQRWLGVQPEPLFDTQRAAAFCGLGFGLGYRGLVEVIQGDELPKGETRSDWLQRPLTESQCHYAAQDVTYLLSVFQELRDRCDRRDVTAWILEDGLEACNLARLSRGPGISRIKNAWRLSRRQLAALQGVSDWREETARRRDKPRSWILDDKACFSVAANMPVDEAALRGLTEIPSAVQKRQGAALLSIVRHAMGLDEASLPAALPAPLDAGQRSLLKNLKSRVREIAEGIDVAPESLLPSRDYELMVRKLGGESVDEPSHWSGWRAEAVVGPLLLVSGASS